MLCCTALLLVMLCRFYNNKTMPFIPDPLYLHNIFIKEDTLIYEKNDQVHTKPKENTTAIQADRLARLKFKKCNMLTEINRIIA